MAPTLIIHTGDVPLPPGWGHWQTGNTSLDFTQGKKTIPMNLDATLSLAVVAGFVATMVVLNAVWRLDSRIAEMSRELKDKILESRAELRGEIAKSRAGLKGDIQRLETRIDRLETKIDDVETKVDDGNQRLARIEGRLEGRQERLTAGSEAD